MSRPAKEVLSPLEIMALMQDGYRADRVFSTGEVLLWKEGQPYCKTLEQIRSRGQA